MSPTLLATTTAFGLAASAGLNTTLPLFIIGLLARLGYINLASPFDALSSTLVLIVLGILAAAEVIGDKIPGLDSFIQTLQLPIAAAAGAILFASQSSAITWVSPDLALIVGLVTAGGVHASRMMARPAITASTFGVGNPVLSTFEDASSVSLASLAVFFPQIALVLLLILLAVMAFAVIWATRRGMLLAHWMRARTARR